jgi:hypothetical protein
MSRQRDLRRREQAPVLDRELAGRLFAIRLTRSLAGGPTVSLAEWFTLYRLVVPRTPNGRQGPRQLEEAWRARQLRRAGLTLRDVAREMGWITDSDIEKARSAPAINRKLPDEARVASAERRLRRNEALLVRCEQRIRAADLPLPTWLAVNAGQTGALMMSPLGLRQ